MNRRELVGYGLASLSATALSPLPAFAQAKYPDRNVKLVVPFGAGGVVDSVARQWTERMKGPLGATIVIENQGGAGGTIGMGEVARAAPDGYTLGFGNTSTLVLNPAIMPKVPYDPARDFTVLSILAVSVSGIIVHPSIPVKNLKEFVAYAKANQDKLSYGSAGAGTMTNLAGELFKQLIGAPKIVHVPYKGAGPSLTDQVSGAIPMSTINITGQVLSLHEAGKIRVLAVTANNRLKGAPDIPTAIEAGLPGMTAELFTAVLIQSKTPKPIVEHVYKASQTVMKDPGMQEALVKQGLEPIVDSSPEKATAYVQEELKRWTPLIETLGLKQKK
jgi:tripartite-type tricarboxylate transporter receptor subunit TctC